MMVMCMLYVSKETLKRNRLRDQEIKLKNELWRVQSELYNMEHDMPPLPDAKPKGLWGYIFDLIDTLFTWACIVAFGVMAVAFVVWLL